ncbi:MAG: hypothetical protein JRH18_22650 [Deltaproteobacteria bacterium]|nr:hypothetical protein [Deltaproteobacteria bacterium]MBW2154451.1 hypothetical protein [Deltaproteobacteria bacterium]
MNSDREPNNKQFQFLLNEYSFLADYLKYNYDERDKYIQFYVGALAAIAAVIGVAIKNAYWDVIFILVALNILLSYFVLLKVLFQRVVVTEYKNHLNQTRGKLFELAGGQAEIKSILLPTDACVKYLKTSGGDAAIMRILEIITAVSTSATLFLIFWRYSGLQETGKWLGLSIGTISFFVVLIIIERHWQNVLRDRDRIREEPKKNEISVA